MRIGLGVHKPWANVFCTLVPDICGSSVKKPSFLLCPIGAQNFWWLLDFWKFVDICASLYIYL
jgi:hypothetical protein